MSATKLLGFYNFHITADKTRDFFLENGFSSDDLSITKITPGLDPFMDNENKPASIDGSAEKKEPASATDSMQHDHSIRSFFHHLLHLGPKDNNPDKPFKAENGGYILTVIAGSPEDTELAKDILKRHGAQYVKEFSI